LVGNWAVLVTVYQLLSRFVNEIDGDYMLPPWQDSIVETVQIVREERASEVFLNVLGQLLASGEAMLAENRQHPIEPPPGTTIVGYRDEQFIHLLPEIAYRAVNKVHALKFPVGAIGSVLKEEGWLLTHDGGCNLTIIGLKHRFRSPSHRSVCCLSLHRPCISGAGRLVDDRPLRFHCRSHLAPVRAPSLFPFVDNHPPCQCEATWMRSSAWIDKNGESRVSLNIDANRLTLLDRVPANEPETEQIPF